jgi:hypothetical protein
LPRKKKNATRNVVKSAPTSARKRAKMGNAPKKNAVNVKKRKVAVKNISMQQNHS